MLLEIQLSTGEALDSCNRFNHATLLCLDFQHHKLWSFFVFSKGLFVLLIIVDHHCLIFLFIIYSIFSFICMLYRLLLVRLSFFSWPLWCLFLFDLQILITSLWHLQTLLKEYFNITFVSNDLIFRCFNQTQLFIIKKYNFLL